MEEKGFHCSDSISSLLCGEDEICLDGDDEDEEGKTDGYLLSLNDPDTLKTEEEYVQILVKRESNIKYLSDRSIKPIKTNEWLKCARLEAVRWILKTRILFNFSHQTAFLSICYMDRFLSRRSVEQGKSWAIRLLSVACLSLAAKMEEPKVPALCDFQVEHYDFDSRLILRMELLVLNTLDWRMNSITPFAYLRYFAIKFFNDLKHPGLLSRAGKIILATTEVMNLMDHRPSAIAAAAILAASDPQLTKYNVQVKMSVISPCRSLEDDLVFSCYNLMQSLELGKIKIPNGRASSNLMSVGSSSVSVLHSSEPPPQSKRKRLTFD